MKDKEFLISKGFEEIFIRRVPLGTVLNKETESTFPVVTTNSYISPCNKFIIQEGNKEYDLILNSNNLNNPKIKNYSSMSFSEFRDKPVEVLIDIYEKL